MGQRISLSKARAQRDGDCHEWTAQEMLEDLLEQIKTGQLKPKQIAIHWFTDQGVDDMGRELIGYHDYVVAKCSIAEHMMLLTVGHTKMIDILRGES